MYTHYNFTLPKENLALLNNNFGLEMGQQAQKQEKESLQRISEPLYRNEKESKFTKASNTTNSESYQWKKYEIK